MGQQHSRHLRLCGEGRILGHSQTESESHAHSSLRSTIIKQPARHFCDKNHLRHLLNIKPSLEVLAQCSRNGDKEWASLKYYVVLIIMDVWKRLLAGRGGDDLYAGQWVEFKI